MPQSKKWHSLKGSIMSLLINRILLCLLPIVHSSVLAEETKNDGLGFNWGGFVTQGWTKSTDNDFFGQSSKSGGSFDFRELGFYGSYSFSPEVRMSGLLLSRVAGSEENGEVNVDHLIFDWSPIQTVNMQAGVRLGRIKHTIGFYNDTRDIAFTRPGIVLPQSIYQDRIRDLALSSDGVGGYLRKETPLGYLSFDMQIGKVSPSSDTEVNILGRDWAGKITSSNVLVARALYESPTNAYRFALTAINSTLPFEAGSTDPFLDSEVDFSLTGLSAQWNLERWSLTSELMYLKTDRKGFNGVFKPALNEIETFYVQLDHRFNSQWSVFARYDVVYVDVNDKNGQSFAQANLGSDVPAFQRYAKDWTFGAGYEPTPSWLLRAEFHHINGTAWLSSSDNPVISDTGKSWNLAILQASYRF